MPDQPKRFALMTQAQRDLLVNPQVAGDREAVMRELIAAYDAAPADPAKAMLAATWEWDRDHPEGERGRELARVVVELRALGMPDA